MPQVTMPDGQVVDMPDTLSPELGKRLRAFQAAQTGPAPAAPPAAAPKRYATWGDIFNPNSAWARQMDARPWKPGYMPSGQTIEQAMNRTREGILQLPYQAGGTMAEVATRYGAPPPLAAGLGTAVNVGLNALPMIYGGGAAKGAAPLFRKGAESLMQRAVKPTLDELRSGDASTAIQTMLDEGIGLSRGGLQKMRDKISELNDLIKNKIASSTSTVDVNQVYRPLQEKLQQFKMQVNPDSDMKAITNAWDEFKNHPLLAGKTNIPIQTAQALKQGTYKQLAKKYGEMGSASTEAQKAIARGLKEGVEKGAPETVEWNRQEARLLRTLDIAERRVLMDANKNPMGLALLTHDPASFAAFMADKSAAFKSLMARILNAGQKQIPATLARTGIVAAETPNQLQPPGTPPQ